MENKLGKKWEKNVLGNYHFKKDNNCKPLRFRAYGDEPHIGKKYGVPLFCISV